MNERTPGPDMKAFQTFMQGLSTISDQTAAEATAAMDVDLLVFNPKTLGVLASALLCAKLASAACHKDEKLAALLEVTVAGIDAAGDYINWYIKQQEAAAKREAERSRPQ